MKILSEFQESVIQRLYAANMPFVASATRRMWSIGQTYYIDSRCKVPRGLRKDFEKANKEASKEANVQ